MGSFASRALEWLRTHDPGLSALRRAARAAIVMPAMFAIGEKAIGNAGIATFAAFGSFALLLLVDFTGPAPDRLLAQAVLAATGAVLVCVATAASRETWVAAAAMAVVGFAVVFAGVVSSVIAGATFALLLAFILPVTLPGPLSSIPDRLAGWGLAAAASLPAIVFLWPAPSREPLRGAAVAACRALAARLRAEVGFMLGERPSAAERDDAVAASNEAVDRLQRLFFATPYRPTALSTSTRAIVRLVDEIGWLNTILAQSPQDRAGTVPNRRACAVKSSAAEAIDRGADVLATPGSDPAPLRGELVRLREKLLELEVGAMHEPLPHASEGQTAPGLISALDPGFRAQELTFAVTQIADNIDLSASAERRSPLERLLGRRPAGVAGPVTAAQERAVGHIERHSVWLHNSIRAGVGLGVGVAVANESGVQHSFWVVLGTLSVLRSNALNTGQNIVRGLAGTVAGFAVGALLLWAIGTETTLLWFLLPLVILFAGIAPAAISFAAGQAAFTLTLVILFNLIQPVGWRVGLVRIEDVAIGCAVSLGVGLLLWPRGAAAALGSALTAAYAEGAHYLTSAVEYGLGRCDHGTPVRDEPQAEALRAAAAARRLDDAFRTYLAERAAKPVPLAEATSLVTGVAALRLAADAVTDLWRRDDGSSAADRAEAGRELRAIGALVGGWYAEFAAALEGRAALPLPLERDQIDVARLAVAVRRDLADADGRAGAVAVRVIWTGDHLDAARRLQAALVQPARALVEHARPPLPGPRRFGLGRRAPQPA